MSMESAYDSVFEGEPSRVGAGAGQPVSRLPGLLQRVVMQGMDQLQALLSQAMRCSIDLKGESTSITA